MDIFSILESAADSKKAVEMSAYLKNQFAFLGIQKPERTGLTREFLAQKKKEKNIDWALVDACYARPEREFHYLAIDYLLLKKDVLVPADMQRIEALITRHSWWDSVDAYHTIAGHLLLKYPEVKSILQSWMTSENLWLRRMAIICQLHLKNNTDTAMLADAIVKNLGTKEFFINKGIGWALREYSKTDPEWVRAFLKSHKLSPLSVREAGKYL